MNDSPSTNLRPELTACERCEVMRQRCEEATRQMSSYRTQAWGLRKELEETRERLSKSRASHKKIIAGLRVELADIRAAVDEYSPGLLDAAAVTIPPAEMPPCDLDDRASIVAFLESLASAFEGPEADLTRTLAAQIARGDDLRGDK